MSVDRPAPARPIDPDRLAELEEQKAFLLRSLDDLERERAAGDLDEADYQQLKDGYTARAAAVLRELDEGLAALAPQRPVSWPRRLAVVGVVVALAVVAGLLVARSSGQRLPGDAVSGEIADSVNSLLAEARSLQATDPQAAIERYDEVLGLEPDNVEAITYQGWMLARVGADAAGRGLEAGDQLVQRGVEAFDRAIALQPSYADAHCFKAITLFRYFGDATGAKAPVEACVASNPPQVVRSLVANLSAEIDAVLAAPPTTAPAAPSTSG